MITRSCALWGRKLLLESFYGLSSQWASWWPSRRFLTIIWDRREALARRKVWIIQWHGRLCKSILRRPEIRRTHRRWLKCWIAKFISERIFFCTSCLVVVSTNVSCASWDERANRSFLIDASLLGSGTFVYTPRGWWAQEVHRWMSTPLLLFDWPRHKQRT